MDAMTAAVIDDGRATTFSGRRASQMRVELDAFELLLRDAGVRSYGEIGARHGDTFHHVMRSLPQGSHGVALDLPGGLWGKGSSRGALNHAIADLRASGYDVSALYGNSQTTATCRIFRSRGPYDAILIDGDHTLVGVTHDWRNYREVAPIIAFHDIVGLGEVDKPTGSPVEVPLLWESIKRATKLKTVELVAEGSRMGIGVVWTR